VVASDDRPRKLVGMTCRINVSRGDELHALSLKLTLSYFTAWLILRSFIYFGSFHIALTKTGIANRDILDIRISTESMRRRGEGGEPVQITGALKSGRGPGPEYVECVFNFSPSALSRGPEKIVLPGPHTLSSAVTERDNKQKRLA
jgi:hypothetical protein